jgi:hypothetical protein
MAKYELKIYGENDEVLKTYATDNVMWGFYLEAVKASEDMDEMTTAERFEMINSFVKRLFIGLTDEELEHGASGDDVINVFNQLMKKARSIGGTGGTKNLTAAGK